MAVEKVQFIDVLSNISIATYIRAAIYIIAGYITARVVRRVSKKALSRLISVQYAKRISKFLFFIILLVFLIITLQELGFKIGVIVGALGIFSVAIGFASQTSVSNLISGLFIIAERSFKIGDSITINGTRGTVLSIDLLSIKLRTADNMLVRIPNESAIKSQIMNYSHFETRRIPIPVGVAYDSDLSKVERILMQLATENPLCLQDPAPSVVIDNFADSSINLTLRAWANGNDFLTVKTQLQQSIQEKFAKENINIPYPHVHVIQ